MRRKKSLIKDYKDLLNDAQTGIQRGFAFEKLFNELLEVERLEPFFSNERICLFKYDGVFFNLFCNWQDKQSTTNEIYAFQGRFSSNLIGTIGIFVSMSNFEKNAPNELERGKSINLLLFTKEDVNACFSMNYRFSDILKAKLRYAALYGSVLHIPYIYAKNQKNSINKNLFKR